MLTLSAASRRIRFAFDLLLLLPAAMPAALGADGAPAPTIVEVAEIQGPGNTSPFVGRVVTVKLSVVTAVATNGFFMQAPDKRADGDPETSEGVFVYTEHTPAVEVGDVVDVTGEVQEFFGATELTHAMSRTVARGARLPEPARWNELVPRPDSRSATF